MKILLINSKHYRRGGADVVYLDTGNLLEKYGHEVLYFSQNSLKNNYTSYSKYFIEEKDFIKMGYLKRILNFLGFFFH